MIDPIRDRLEAYSHPVKDDEKIIVELPIIKNFPNKPEGLDIDTFPNIYPIEKP